MMVTGINFDEYDKIPVEVSGNGAKSIPHIERFKEANLHALIFDNIDRARYIRPTPIQKHSIPIIMSGRDLMACAQTGSGKTGGFLFPAIAAMLVKGPPRARRSSRRQAYPVTLLLAPTRELASQIADEGKKFIYRTGLRCVCVYGGVEMRLNCIELDKGVDILVATPGRLEDLLQRSKVSLGTVETLIFDEADRMLDMGFEPHIRDIVEKYDMPSIREGRQTVMFSATFPNQIQQLASDFLDDYIFLAVGRVGSTHEFIKQEMRYCEENQKWDLINRLLNEQTEEGMTIIFVETKRRADDLLAHLNSRNIPTCAIHGDRTQSEREAALSDFKTGVRPVMVATDVASRGLDIPNVNLVVNFDLPNSIDDYVHRIGRTGRAGNKGRAISFVNDNNRSVLRELWAILEEAKQDIPSWFEDMTQRAASQPMRGGKGEKGTKNPTRDARAGQESVQKDAAASRAARAPPKVAAKEDAW